MKVLIRNNKGFSLVELMVVVAIIGILAAIAVPNFQKFAAKSKQSEAKSNLSALYSAERAFYAEWQLFYGDFSNIGYSPTGNLKYNHGFNGAGALPAVGYPGVAGVKFNSSAYCAGTLNANFCSSPATGIVGAVTPAGTGTGATFIAAAIGDIGGAAPDQWTINESKDLKNPVSGL